MTTVPPEFPAAALEIEYPDRELNRLTTFFRPFVAIPIMVVSVFLAGPVLTNPKDHTVVIGSGFVFGATVLMILFRQKYPRWWFDWNLAMMRFNTRLFAYLALLRDEYPSTDEEQAVHVTLLYPDARADLNRWLPLVKWFLAIPHYFVLLFLGIAAFVSVVLAWFAILFTGRYPRGLFEFVIGVFRWALRVNAYAFLLVTDQYPPFRLGR
jgi:uncharacterized protein DUF4389